MLGQIHCAGCKKKPSWIILQTLIIRMPGWLNGRFESHVCDLTLLEGLGIFYVCEWDQTCMTKKWLLQQSFLSQSTETTTFKTAAVISSNNISCLFALFNLLMESSFLTRKQQMQCPASPWQTHWPWLHSLGLLRIVAIRVTFLVSGGQHRP